MREFVLNSVRQGANRIAATVLRPAPEPPVMPGMYVCMYVFMYVCTYVYAAAQGICHITCALDSHGNLIMGMDCVV